MCIKNKTESVKRTENGYNYIVRMIKTTIKQIIIDTLCYLLLMSITTALLIVIPEFLIIILIVTFVKRKNNNFKSNLNWFEIIKLISVVIGLVTIIIMQKYPNLYSFQILRALLIINIIEAITTNFETLLILYLIWELMDTPQYKIEFAEQFTMDTNIIHFPVSSKWIIIYGIWNALFTYRKNFSHSVRLLLIVPLFFNSYLWLVSRTYSLILNMLFRATKIIWLFNPGYSYLTNK